MVIRSFRAALPAVVFASMLASGTVSRAAGATIHPAPTCVSPCNTIGIGTISSCTSRF